MADRGPDRLFRAVERYVANPVLRVLLRSPLHWPVSRSLLLLSYEGRHSGRRWRTLVAYERDGTDGVVTTDREVATWWHSFESGHPATLWIRGEPVEATGTATTDVEAVTDWLATLADRNGRILSLFDVPDDPDGDDLASVAPDLVVVRFALA